MFKILAICFASLALGAILSFNSLHLPLRPGYIGAILVILGTLWVRRIWHRRAASVGDEPNSSERNAWLGMVGTALICGFVLAVLTQPGSEVHSKTGGTGGFDSWLIFGSMLVAYLILRERNPQRDERDVAITHLGTKAAYYALIVLLSAFLFFLAFARPHLTQRFTHWLIANSLVTLIMLACLVQYLTQLICYWRDLRNLRIEP